MIILILIMILGTNPKDTFIKEYLPISEKYGKEYNLPKDLILAAGAEESGWGTSFNSRKRNNFFGLMCFKKCKSSHCESNYIKFNTPEECFEFYYQILSTERYKGLKGKSAEEAADILQACGYAANPDYAKNLKILIRSIKKYK